MGELWEILKKADVKGKGYDNHWTDAVKELCTKENFKLKCPDHFLIHLTISSEDDADGS